jgi:transcriptional regulator with XRE-family HTH domain
MKIKSKQQMLKLVGKKLALLRIDKGYATMKDFAIKFKLPLVQYWRLEKGKTNATLGTLFKLFKIHKVGLREFFYDIEMLT